MKKFLNTLYITTPNTYLSKEGSTVLINADKQVKHQFPIHILQGIVCFGHVMCSPSLMHLCAEHQVAISFMSDYGRFIAKVQNPISGNVLLRKEQYRKADNPEQCIKIASHIITGKILNSRTILMRAAREIKNLETQFLMNQASGHLARLVKNIPNYINLNELRGLEGEAAKTYFSAFDCMILHQKEDFFFKERSKAAIR